MNTIDEQLDALEDLIFELDLAHMSKDQLTDLARMARHLLSSAESKLLDYTDQASE